jgi:hypothetical protein
MEAAHIIMLIIGLILGAAIVIMERWYADRREKYQKRLMKCESCGKKQDIMKMYSHSSKQTYNPEFTYGPKSTSLILCKDCYRDQCGSGSLIIGA